MATSYRITPLGKVLGGVVMLLGVGIDGAASRHYRHGLQQGIEPPPICGDLGMIAGVPLFASMDYSEIAEITKLLYTRTFMPGVPMVRAHDAGDAMFIIANGEAVVEISPSRQVVLKEGEFFGEMALLEHRRHKHDVVAKTHCRLDVLDSGSLGAP